MTVSLYIKGGVPDVVGVCTGLLKVLFFDGPDSGVDVSLTTHTYG